LTANDRSHNMLIIPDYQGGFGTSFEIEEKKKSGEDKAMLMEKLVRPREVARQLAVSRSTIYRWFWEGKLRGVRLRTGSLRILATSVEEMVGEVW
jgi:excisionase family DNA binding protein